MLFAQGIITFAIGYICLGGIFAIWLVTRGLKRIDPIAQTAGWGFKLLILPGLCALWPLVFWQNGRGKQQA